MLDIKFIRNNVEKVKKGIESKQVYNIDIDLLINLDDKRKKLLLDAEGLKSTRNKVSTQIPKLKKEKKDTDSLLKEMKETSLKIKTLDNEIACLDNEIINILSYIPNMPNSEVPVGGESNNKEIKTWGNKPCFDFKPKPHSELCESLDIIDFKRGAKISGTGFALYKKLGAKLERSLISFMLDYHVDKHGYTEIFPPFMVNEQTMYGTGQLPKMKNDMYKIQDEDMYLIPTAEVPVTNIFRDETLKEADLPYSFSAYTPCFRKEAGSYGKDTKGLIRMHQFDKVELVRFVHPENSYKELDILLTHAEAILQALNLHYRVLILATGDLSFAAAKCYDIEVWAPGQNDYLEVSSCSNFEDFQARRMSIKFKCSKTNKNKFVHTLNGSGLALARLVIAIIETYQQTDGTILVPNVLKPYLGVDMISMNNEQ